MNIAIIGGIVFLGIFGFQLWYAIHAKNIGTFDRTSQIVWGSIGVVVLLISLGAWLLSRTT